MVDLHDELIMSELISRKSVEFSQLGIFKSPDLKSQNLFRKTRGQSYFSTSFHPNPDHKGFQYHDPIIPRIHVSHVIFP